MASRPNRARGLAMEPLEDRLFLSGGNSSNVIGSAVGIVPRPHAVGRTSAAVSARNLTPRKPATILGLFVQPTSGSSLQPQILAARENSGHALPFRPGRPFLPRVSGQTVAFTKVRTAGDVTTNVTGASLTMGAYLAQTTLVGDVNGDGTVNLADTQAFAPSYMSRFGQPNYNPAADFNHNGFINLDDAKALMRNMPPLTPKVPLTAKLILDPRDQIRYSGSSISGAATLHQTVTIIGHTMPGSIVLEDNHDSRLPGGTQAYTFTGPAHAVDASGIFTVTSVNTSGLNNNDFLIISPYGQTMIIDLPVFWVPYAAGKVD